MLLALHKSVSVCINKFVCARNEHQNQRHVQNRKTRIWELRVQQQIAQLFCLAANGRSSRSHLPCSSSHSLTPYAFIRFINAYK
jgi:hypothetical protein